MQEQNKKPPEYYKNDVKYLDLWIKRNFSDKGREIGCEYESCFVSITKEQLKLLVNAIGDKDELMLTGKGWLNDISDPNSSKLHVELLSHSQSNVDYIEEYNKRKQNSNYEKPQPNIAHTTASQYLEAKNNTSNDSYVSETDYTSKASQVKTTTGMDDDIPF